LNFLPKARIKLRRIFYRLGKYSMFIISIITCYNLTTHILEIRAEKLRSKNRKRLLAIISFVLLWVSAIIIALLSVIKYIKHLKKGYLFDLFDRDTYDVIDPDEESPAESIIKSELSNTDETSAPEKLIINHIPLDEEATEDDYK